MKDFFSWTEMDRRNVLRIWYWNWWGWRFVLPSAGVWVGIDPVSKHCEPCDDVMVKIYLMWWKQARKSFKLLSPLSKVMPILFFTGFPQVFPIFQFSASWQGNFCLVSMALALLTSGSSCSWCSTGSEKGDRLGDASASASASVGASVGTSVAVGASSGASAVFSRLSRPSPSTWALRMFMGFCWVFGWKNRLNMN